MHNKIKARLDEDLVLMKHVLEGQFKKNSGNIFRGVLQEICKVLHLTAGSESHIYWTDAYWLIKKVAPIDKENTEWHDAIADIGLLLDGTNSCYDDKELEPNAREIYPEEVYSYLLGLTTI
jgi:hypothetical protein